MERNKENIPPSRFKRARAVRLGDMLQVELDQHSHFEQRMVQDIQKMGHNIELLVQHLILAVER